MKALTYGEREYLHDSRLLIDISLFVVHMLSMLVKQVKDEQAYIVMREQMHRNTAESTNGRVKWWSIFQMAVLVAEGVFQVWWLKRFFEVRRSLHDQSCFTNQWFCAYTGKARCLKENRSPLFQDIRVRLFSPITKYICHGQCQYNQHLAPAVQAKPSGYKMVAPAYRLGCVPSIPKMPP